MYFTKHGKILKENTADMFCLNWQCFGTTLLAAHDLKEVTVLILTSCVSVLHHTSISFRFFYSLGFQMVPETLMQTGFLPCWICYFYISLPLLAMLLAERSNRKDCRDVVVTSVSWWQEFCNVLQGSGVYLLSSERQSHQEHMRQMLQMFTLKRLLKLKLFF